MTTLSKVKDYLGITSSTYDTVLNSLIDNLSQFIKTILERTFSSEERTEYFDGGGKEIFLKEYPIYEATLSVYYNNGDQSNPNWVEIDARNYIIYYNEGIIKHLGLFPGGERNIKVIYTGGYATIPDDLELLTKELVAKEFEQRKAQGKVTESLGGATVDWKNQLTEMQKMILDKYKRIV